MVRNRVAGPAAAHGASAADYRRRSACVMVKSRSASSTEPVARLLRITAPVPGTSGHAGPLCPRDCPGFSKPEARARVSRLGLATGREFQPIILSAVDMQAPVLRAHDSETSCCGLNRVDHDYHVSRCTMALFRASRISTRLTRAPPDLVRPLHRTTSSFPLLRLMLLRVGCSIPPQQVGPSLASSESHSDTGVALRRARTAPGLPLSSCTRRCIHKPTITRRIAGLRD